MYVDPRKHTGVTMTARRISVRSLKLRDTILRLWSAFELRPLEQFAITVPVEGLFSHVCTYEDMVQTRIFTFD
jgi:hypothetical protein